MEAKFQFGKRREFWKRWWWWLCNGVNASNAAELERLR